MEFGSALKAARRAKKMTLEDVARLVGTDSGNLSRVENGKQSVSTEMLSKLMVALDLSFEIPGQDTSALSLGYPLLNWKELPGHLGGNGSPEAPVMESVVKAGPDAFWVVVQGDFMCCETSPSFVEGCRILVDRRQTTLENGGFFLFHLKGPNETVFRQFVGYEGQGFLRPLRTIYGPIPMPEDAVVLGRIVDCRQIGI
ncbi:helix-turn-helix domain-containing protein [Pseudomonas serbica]|jgi:transcriptional regulator with XRE-family HTH domain|uniref:helix-turn-helix domain-containing protein n=1 Tax=Pseudomonas serbica TaxID=2965074 RepID=UPI00237A388B|nr:XRE family transcriptional regulator [Pseudomonas serbica]